MRKSLQWKWLGSSLDFIATIGYTSISEHTGPSGSPGWAPALRSRGRRPTSGAEAVALLGHCRPALPRRGGAERGGRPAHAALQSPEGAPPPAAPGRGGVWPLRGQGHEALWLQGPCAHLGRRPHTRVRRRRRQRGRVRHAPGNVGVRHDICPWRQVISVLGYHAGGAAGRGGEGHCARPGEHGGSAGPRAEGTPEREAQDCGDGQCPAGRAARDGENMGQRPLASHGKGGQEGAGP